MKLMTRLLTLQLCLAPFSAYAATLPEASLQRLVEGNDRYTKDQFTSPDRTQERRLEVVSSQQPFAVIVGCSDSRVAPEIIFDQGIGDLFVVRVAGNVVGPVELDSIDYSALVLNSSIVLVLGHENCGAVKAVLAGQTKDIPAVAQLIEPAIAKVRNDPDHMLDHAIHANVEAVVTQLKNSPVLAQLMTDGKLNVVGGYYNLKSGKVDLLPE